MPTEVFYPSAFDSQHAYASVNSSYPTSNPIRKGSNNSTYTQINLTTGSQADTYFYYDFDLSSIPEGAEILSVTCSYKAYISTTSTSYVTTRSAQLYSGNTEKGSAGSFSTNATEQNLTAGTWTWDELQNARIRLYAKRGYSRTTSTYYIRFYGATLTVEYEDNKPTYAVTVESSDGITTEPTGTNGVKEGNPFEVSIYGTVGSVLDNGVNVTSQLEEHTVSPTGTLTKYPASYTTSGNINGTRYQNAIGQGSSATATGNDYSGSSGSTATIYYSFDFSEIPTNATITSVSVTVGGHLESTTSSSEVARLQLYSGSTAKGTEKSFSSTSHELVTMEPGTWTRAELQEAKLAFTIGYYGGLVNGVDFVVVYALPGGDTTYHTYTIASVMGNHLIVVSAGESAPNFYIQINGVMKAVTGIYQQVGGQMMSVDAADLDQSAKYRRIV